MPTWRTIHLRLKRLCECALKLGYLSATLITAATITKNCKGSGHLNLGPNNVHNRVLFSDLVSIKIYLLSLPLLPTSTPLCPKMRAPRILRHQPLPSTHPISSLNSLLFCTVPSCTKGGLCVPEKLLNELN